MNIERSNSSSTSEDNWRRIVCKVYYKLDTKKADTFTQFEDLLPFTEILVRRSFVIGVPNMYSPHCL